MRTLTGQGQQAVAELAGRYGVSVDAVRALLDAVARGNGRAAQFSHPELGGSGQWMAGGMTMVGDMFNDGLRATVSGLATDLAALLVSTPIYAPTASPPGDVHPANRDAWAWWPAELGQPSSAGGQNDSRYAVFPAARRLAIQSGAGPVLIYDTFDHVITGVQQAQGAAPGTLSFTSQHGTFTVDALRPAPPPATAAPPSNVTTPSPTATHPVDETPASQPPAAAPAPPTAAAAEAAAPGAGPASGGGPTDPGTILATIERLSDLHQRGVLTDDEFAAKKAELLARL